MISPLLGFSQGIVTQEEDSCLVAAVIVRGGADGDRRVRVSPPASLARADLHLQAKLRVNGLSEEG